MTAEWLAVRRARMESVTDSLHGMRADVAACGYFPDLISDGMVLAACIGPRSIVCSSV